MADDDARAEAERIAGEQFPGHHWLERRSGFADGYLAGQASRTPVVADRTLAQHGCLAAVPTEAIRALSAAAPVVADRPTCRTFDDTGHSICEEPARFIVWGHLYEKRDKGPKCGKHLPAGAFVAPFAPLGLGVPAIYEIPAAPVVADVDAIAQAVTDLADEFDGWTTIPADLVERLRGIALLRGDA